MDFAGMLRGEGFDWEGAEDLTALSRDELLKSLEAHHEEERALGYRWQVLRSRMDLIRAELAGRGSEALSAEELAKVLLGELPARDLPRDRP